MADLCGRGGEGGKGKGRRWREEGRGKGRGGDGERRGGKRESKWVGLMSRRKGGSGEWGRERDVEGWVRSH